MRAQPARKTRTASHLLVNLQEQQDGIFEGEIAFYIADPLELDFLLERVEAIILSPFWNRAAGHFLLFTII